MACHICLLFKQADSVMKKFLILPFITPLLMSTSGEYYSPVFNSEFNNAPVQTGSQTKQLISNDNESVICDVNLKYELYKLPIYAPYIEKHQTYKFIYYIEVDLKPEGIYKNGLFSWFNAPFNSHFEPDRSIYLKVKFDSRMEDSVFYTYKNFESSYLSKSNNNVGRAYSKIKSAYNTPGYSGNFGDDASRYYSYTYKYIFINDTYSNSVANTIAEYDPFYMEIYYLDDSTPTSPSDYTLSFDLIDLEGNSPAGDKIGINAETKTGLKVKFYDQFCIDSYGLSENDSIVTISPNFSIVEGEVGGICNDYRFEFNKAFSVKLNFD